MKSIVPPVINNPNERIELLDLLKDWVKTEQNPMFWDYARRINLLFAILNLSTWENNHLTRWIVSLVRLAQLAAFMTECGEGARARKKRSGDDPPINFKKNRPRRDRGESL